MSIVKYIQIFYDMQDNCAESGEGGGSESVIDLIDIQIQEATCN